MLRFRATLITDGSYCTDGKLLELKVDGVVHCGQHGLHESRQVRLNVII